MNYTKLYERVNLELNAEKHLDEWSKTTFKAILLECMSKEMENDIIQQQNSLVKVMDRLIAASKQTETIKP